MAILSHISVEALIHRCLGSCGLQDPKAHGHTSPRKPLNPSVVAFEKYIQNNSEIVKLCHSMFIETKHLVDAKRAHASYLVINDIPTLIGLLDFLLTHTPRWAEAESPSETITWSPFHHLLLIFLETPSGERLFLRNEVNRHLKAILHEWTSFLDTPDSRAALNSQTGWLSPGAISQLEHAANTPTGHRRPFTEIFECPDETDGEFLGFASWNTFVTRRFNPTIRPLPSPQDLPRDCAPVLNPCESTPWQISRQCQLRDRFWLKSQPYSIRDMLDNDARAESFANGTVYQGSLSTLDYHRWHAPVDGTVRGVRWVEGAYFTRPDEKNGVALDGMHSFLMTVAARLVIFIEAADPRIGLIAFVGVGLCDTDIQEGDYLEGGQDIGTFRLGKVTYCLIFCEHVNLQFVSLVDGERKGSNIPVRSLLAWC
ncbi:hypothetical protein FE257_010249 [Aspergillus nanangensis]|uniref:L-tryptophan decarboxylase PsiD-like domain-containing protein n=1 Tax=Aspergillus nanangensis TaxID=2582783 RepID=A0AAD4CIX1_ASPNN|nr:hypothetical protein FE257_010249 [Aspergillus nanangensis]